MADISSERQPSVFEDVVVVRRSNNNGGPSSTSDDSNGQTSPSSPPNPIELTHVPGSSRSEHSDLTPQFLTPPMMHHVPAVSNGRAKRPMQAVGYCRLIAARLGAFALCSAGLIHVFALSVPFIDSEFSLPAKVLIFTGVALMVCALVLGIFFQMQTDSSRLVCYIALLLPTFTHAACAIMCAVFPAAPSISFQAVLIYVFLDTVSLFMLNWAMASYQFIPEEGTAMKMPESRNRLVKQRKVARQSILGRTIMSFVLKTFVMALWLVVNATDRIYLEGATSVRNDAGVHYSRRYLGFDDLPNYAVGVSTLIISVLADIAQLVGWVYCLHVDLLPEEVQNTLLPMMKERVDRMRLVVGPASASMSFDQYLTASGTHMRLSASENHQGYSRAKIGTPRVSATAPTTPAGGHQARPLVHDGTTHAHSHSQMPSQEQESYDVYGGVTPPHQPVLTEEEEVITVIAASPTSAHPQPPRPRPPPAAIAMPVKTTRGAFGIAGPPVGMHVLVDDETPLYSDNEEEKDMSNSAMSDTSNSGNPLVAPAVKATKASKIRSQMHTVPISPSNSSAHQYQLQQQAVPSTELFFNDIASEELGNPRRSNSFLKPGGRSGASPSHPHVVGSSSGDELLLMSHEAMREPGSPMNGSRAASPTESTSSASSTYNNRSFTNMSKMARKQRLDEKNKDESVAKEFDYQIGQQIGVGASATVFKAFMLHTGETTAVKVLRLDPSMKGLEAKVQELKNEIEILKSLEHEHVVRYLFSTIKKAADVKVATPLQPNFAAPSFGNPSGGGGGGGSSSTGEQQHLSAAAPRSKNELQMHIVMEFVSGGSIQDIIKQHGRLEERTAVMYAVQIILGLDYLHSMGIAHRDIKTGNCLVSHEGIVKLADFGCSELLHDPMEESLPMFPSPLKRGGTPDTAAGSRNGSLALGSEGRKNSGIPERKLSTSDRERKRSAQPRTDPVGTPLFMAPEVIRGEVYTTMTAAHSSDRNSSSTSSNGSPTIPLNRQGEQQQQQQQQPSVSPQLVLNTPVLLAADIWSFGCILMHMVTGEMPFAHISDQKFKIMNYVASDGGPVDLPPTIREPPSSSRGFAQSQSPVTTPRRSAVADDSPRHLPSQPVLLKDNLECSLKSTSQYLGSFSEHLGDIMSRCLERDPMKRPTARELTNHPWFQERKLIRSVSSAALTPLTPAPLLTNYTDAPGSSSTHRTTQPSGAIHLGGGSGHSNHSVNSHHPMAFPSPVALRHQQSGSPHTSSSQTSAAGTNSSSSGAAQHTAFTSAPQSF